jgi:outer membrane protein assembly factor BamB
VFVLTGDGVLRRYDSATGRRRWRTKMPSLDQSDAPPTAWGGRVYVTNGGLLFSLDETDGSIVWRRIVQGGQHSSPTLAGEAAFLDQSCMNASSFAVQDGSERWRHHGSCAESFGSTSAYHDGRLWVREQGQCAVLDARSGAEGASYPCWTIPAFDGHTVYAVANGALFARETAAGNELWSLRPGGSSLSAPLVAGHTVFVASSDGHLYAVDEGGTLQGSFPLGAAATPPDEYDSVTLTGMNAGDGLLAVPAGNRLVVFR